MKINFTEFKIIDITGQELQSPFPLYQIIGNKVWEFATDLGLKAIAEAIYRGEEVELNSQQVETIKTSIANPNALLLPYFSRELNAFIDKH